ncbi:hypothetical protein SS50377_25967 [Spironucleus salmonicida]|uniref:Uncharacterized protein n=1 Tax=Spironucleus salmonicida TaxID=348837 RepID=V6LUA8_9EUKA|nr:hypothetical protein SS50377_25967 [Spironucleus salmonicida]|eukprot:EST47291.1 Hypothetical protein SS50377_12638 [Spironucleus salmonicida]
MTFFTEISLTSKLPEFLQKRKQENSQSYSKLKLVTLDPILNQHSFQRKLVQKSNDITTVQPLRRRQKHHKKKQESYQDEDILILFGILKGKDEFATYLKEVLQGSQERLGKAVIDYLRDVGINGVNDEEQVQYIIRCLKFVKK